MVEARIECVCPEIRIPDLNLHLRKGQVVFLSKEAVDKSQDLALARRVKGVALRWVERCQVSKKPVPPWLNPQTRRKVAAAPPPPSAPEPAPEPEVDLAQLEQAAADAVRREMQALQKQLVALTQAVHATLEREPASVPSSELRAVVEEVVSKALVTAGAPKPAPAKPVVDDGWEDDDEPRFIPTGIVDAEAKAKIDVSTESSKGSSLDEAAAALRGTKKPRRRRSKKQE